MEDAEIDHLHRAERHDHQERHADREFDHGDRGRIAAQPADEPAQARNGGGRAARRHQVHIFVTVRVACVAKGWLRMTVLADAVILVGRPSTELSLNSGR